jgi:hypothetical protein
MITKGKLVFDATAMDESDNTGAFLRASDGTLLTHTDVGGKKSLDVNVANTVTVTATDLDIRDLSAAQDNVAISDGTDVLAINADGSLNITDNGGSLTVDATDLDIRNLDHAQDDVAIAQGGNTMVVNADGSINVNADISVVNGSDKAEDAAHSSGDIGTYVLAVRQDSLASSVSADGDYASFKVNSVGALYVEVTKAKPAAYTSILVSQNSVSTTAELVVASDLADRKKILVQNVSGNRTVYLGHANTVTSSNGIRLDAGANIELDLAAGVALYAITSAASADLRILEQAA